MRQLAVEGPNSSERARRAEVVERARHATWLHNHKDELRQKAADAEQQFAAANEERRRQSVAERDALIRLDRLARIEPTDANKANAIEGHKRFEEAERERHLAQLREGDIEVAARHASRRAENACAELSELRKIQHTLFVPGSFPAALTPEA